ncbi:MAG: TetR/AcrR family transcriptional regulator [Prolixibacteraceae bacterium]|jgi:AcrR family transcriptional regulator|nr:TetR/AcrR family transcriptional regulator [Prolixibacteraceae bacterium]
MDKEDLHKERFNEWVEPIKKLFYAYGLKNLSMDDLSRSLGISKKTLYTYVKNKEDLIEKIFLHEESIVFRKSEKIDDISINAIEKLLLISQLIHDELKQINPMIQFEMKKYYPAIFESYMEKKRVFVFEGMKINMQQGISEKLYRDDINIDLVATIYLNSFIELHNSDVCRILDVDFLKIFEVMFENHIRAISTPTGIAYFESRKNDILEYINTNKK